MVSTPPKTSQNPYSLLVTCSIKKKSNEIFHNLDHIRLQSLFQTKLTLKGSTKVGNQGSKLPSLKDAMWSNSLNAHVL